MKKYLLTALLGVFGLFGFASADTIGDFSSSSSMTSYSFSDSSVSDSDIVFNGTNSEFEPEGSSLYYCLSSSDSDFTYYSWNFESCSEESPCSFVNPSCGSFNFNDSTVHFSKSINGTFYLSESPITYSSSEGDSDSSSLISGGTAVFSGIISSLGSAVSEFIPYVAYIGLGLLGAIIGFVAIKRLINRVRAKIFGTFSGGRRR